MRYAIVTETYPPEVNGVALTVHALEAGLRARGHEVDLVRPRQQTADRAAAHEWLTRGSSLPRYPGLRLGWVRPAALRTHWQRARPDAIYIATEGPLGWAALRAALRLRIPVATGFHTRFDRYMHDYGAPLLAPVALAWMRRFHNRGQATLVPTVELLHQLDQAGFRKVRRLPRAVDSAAFHPRHRDATLRACWGVGPRDPVVIHVGRLAAEKNLDLAVRSFRRIQQRLPSARFVWVGDGPSRAALETANPDFIFCGVQRGAELSRHYASADLFLFPSATETFGNVTLEALACGVSTVAFDYGAAAEHLPEGPAGGTAAVGDEAGFLAIAERSALALAAMDGQQRAAQVALCHAAIAGLEPARVAADFDAILSHLTGACRELPHPAAQALRRR